MLDSTHQVIAGIVILTVIGVAYGGRFVFTAVTGRLPANDLQKSFFRAGHATRECSSSSAFSSW